MLTRISRNIAVFGLLSNGLLLSPEVRPQEIDEEKLLDGKFLYQEYAACASCHGADGKGVVEGLTLDPPPPDFTDCSFVSREPRKDWHDVIKHSGTVRGLSSSMPAYDLALTDEQIDAIITYVKSFCTETGWPPGELNFRRPLVTSKAFPENEALFLPSLTKDNNEVVTTSFKYERRFAKRGHWEISLPFQGNTAPGSDFGIADMEIGAKYVIADDLQRLMILTGGLDVGIPTGKAGIGVGDGKWSISPYLAAAKGFERFFLQSSLKVEAPISSQNSESELLLNLAGTLPLTREKKGLYPMVELNLVKSLEASSASLLVTPQLYIAFVKRGHLAFSLGGQFPVAGDSPFDYRILGFFLWEYADGGIWW